MIERTAIDKDHRLTPMDLDKLGRQYRHLLLDDIVPFWMKHGIDWEYGGVLSCMNDDGSLLSGDKFTWSQARSVWTFSALYNRIEKEPQFLKVAENSVRFLLAHGRDEQGRWVYCTNREGTEILEGPTSIYADCFVVYGLNEYYRAVRDERLQGLIYSTFDRIRRRVEQPDFHETAPYRLPPGRRNHGVPMMLTAVTNELLETRPDGALEELLSDYVSRIMDHFVRPERRLLLEFLSDRYEELPPNEGTFVMPGHAIESMWFVLHAARRTGNRELIRKATEVIRWHLDAGWDREYGGIFLGIDAEGRPPFQPHADKKPWWPHTEALYALLAAHKLTGEPWCLPWYEKVHEWSFEHYPTPHGEWLQRADRQGRPITDVIALPVKDPFHLPRAATLIVQLLESEP
jgi:N-acylglucosamine 2-epimerase